MLLLGPDRPCHFVIVKKKGVCPHVARIARLAGLPHVHMDMAQYSTVQWFMVSSLHVARQIEAQWLVRVMVK